MKIIRRIRHSISYTKWHLKQIAIIIIIRCTTTAPKKISFHLSKIYVSSFFSQLISITLIRSEHFFPPFCKRFPIKTGNVFPHLDYHMVLSALEYFLCKMLLDQGFPSLFFFLCSKESLMMATKSMRTCNHKCTYNFSHVDCIGIWKNKYLNKKWWKKYYVLPYEYLYALTYTRIAKCEMMFCLSETVNHDYNKSDKFSLK